MPEAEVRSDLVAAAERVFATRGYAAATVGNIIEASGTSRASFYRYFSSKQDMFDELSRRCFKEMRDVIASLATGDRQSIEASLRRYRKLNERYSGVIRAWTELTGAPDSPLHEAGTAAVRAMFQETAAVLAAAPAQSAARQPAASEASPAATRAALLFLLVERASFYVSSGVSRVDPERLGPTLATLVGRGFLGVAP